MISIVKTRVFFVTFRTIKK